MLSLGTCAAGGQTRLLRDASVAQEPAARLGASDPVVRDGLLSIEVAVTDAGGKPVSDLSPWDFTLLDNGEAAKIRTLRNSQRGRWEPPGELIFVVDTLNLSAPQLEETQSAIAHFLRRVNGRLEFPCVLYRLTRDGLFSSLRPSTDGTLLAEELEQKRTPWTVWRTDRGEINSAGSWESGLPRNRLSLRALGAIAVGQRDVPGRKVVVWIGPGWPVTSGDIDFDDATELSTRLREARITLDNVNVWLNPVLPFNYREYLDAPRAQKDMQPPKLSLQVIATQTGGVVLDSSEDLEGDIERGVEQLRNFYTLTFNPPHTSRMDEYHDIRVEVSRPALMVRAPAGYYNEPVYFDNPRDGIERVTVAQLEELVHGGTDLQRKLANVELTERLSTARLESLVKGIRSERERQALTAVADVSLALAPPADEVGSGPPPALDEQRAILQRTLDYLRNAIPRLPDFYALRNTIRFEEPMGRDNESWKMPHQDQTLHFATGEHATVLYRNGQEVIEKKKKLGKSRVVQGVRARDLETRGTFGPVLAFVLTAGGSNSGDFRWKRWERGAEGDLAVFSYRVGGANAVPEITYCCLPGGNGTIPFRWKADTYGEFAVNPATGAIMRIEINADLDEERDPDVPLIRSQIMVEYGAVELGGKVYICPQRSVEVSRGRSLRELREWGSVFSVYGWFETMINDVTFGGYHKFGSEFRMLPGVEESQ